MEMLFKFETRQQVYDIQGKEWIITDRILEPDQTLYAVIDKDGLVDILEEKFLYNASQYKVLSLKKHLAKVEEQLARLGV